MPFSKIIKLVLATFLTSTVCQAGVIAHYNFDNLTTGLVNQAPGGTALNLTSTGTVTMIADGKSGGALKFTNSSYASGSMAGQLSSYPFSFSLWVRNSVTPGGRNAIMSVSDFSATDRYYDMGINSSGNAEFTRRNGSFVTLSSTGTAVTLSNGQWHHLCVVYTSATSAAMYLDGVLSVETTTQNLAIAPGLDIVTIGGLLRTTGLVIPYSGEVDDVQIYDQALTAQTVVALFNNPGVVAGGNNSPTFAGATFSVDENSPNGTAVGTVTGSDPDAGQSLSYSITSGNFGNAFAIHPTTGAITVNGAINYEMIQTYNLTVEALDDHATFPLATAAAVTVNVGDVADGEAIRPNIVFIIADDLGTQDLGCYGNTGIQTPHIDSLAANGMRFDRVFLTAASCGPCRASLATGRWPHSNGQTDLNQPNFPYPTFFDGLDYFPELLKNSGYYTAHCGKWHIGYDWTNPNGANAGPARHGFDYRESTGTGSLATKWVNVLQNRPTDKPFFMWFAAHDPHDPWTAPSVHSSNDVTVPPYLLDTTHIRNNLVKYYDEIARLDGDVGAVIAELNNQGILNNTMIVFVTDNGRAFWRSKGHIYDSGMQTPFVVQWPAQISPGQVCNQLVSAIDFAPTFLDLALEDPTDNTFQGRSVKDLFTSPNTPLNRYVFSEQNWHGYSGHRRSVREGNYLYIKNSHPELSNLGIKNFVNYMHGLWQAGSLTDAQSRHFVTPRPIEELFDTSTDPHQIVDLASNPAFATKLSELREVVNVWQNITGDTVPANYVPDWYYRELTSNPGARKASNLLVWGDIPGIRNFGVGDGSEDSIREFTNVSGSVNSFQSWADTNLAAQPANEQSHLADPDGDGLPNYVEFFNGTSPLLANHSVNLTAKVLPNGAPQFSFFRTPGVIETEWTLFVSDDLQTWEAVDSQVVTQEVIPAAQGMEEVRLTLAPLAVDNSKKFGKLKWTWIGSTP